MAQEDASQKKGLLGRLLGLAGAPKPQPEASPQPVVQRPGTGPVRSGTDVFKPSAQAAAVPRPRPAAPATQQLVVPQAPKPQMGTGNVFPGDGLPPDEASEERLAFLDAFFDDPTASRLFQDATYMYKVVSDERNHQVSVILLQTEALRSLEESMDPEELADEPVPIPALPPGPDGEPLPEVLAALALQERRSARVAERERLRDERDQAQARVNLLFRLMKELTGKKGRTGGTGFLAGPPQESQP
ncbi:MAG: hypothetical protein VKO64_07145 [Candidatus Sericytochromatia bacterium]|nr:hypothetical protein [Candidatus Sericytochromatia bacterium]